MGGQPAFIAVPQPNGGSAFYNLPPNLINRPGIQPYQPYTTIGSRPPAYCTLGTAATLAQIYCNCYGWGKYCGETYGGGMPSQINLPNGEPQPLSIGSIQIPAQPTEDNPFNLPNPQYPVTVYPPPGVTSPDPANTSWPYGWQSGWHVGSDDIVYDGENQPVPGLPPVPPGFQPPSY